MSRPKTDKSEGKTRTDDAAQAARARELREIIERVEAEKSGSARPAHESPNDFVERKMREKTKK
jgi:hypothetical protein